MSDKYTIFKLVGAMLLSLVIGNHFEFSGIEVGMMTASMYWLSL